MNWWNQKKKKKEEKEARAYDEKQRLIRVRERGAKLLEDLIECCDGKSNPIKFFSADQILEATNNCSYSNHVSKYYRYPYDWYSGKNENHHMILIKKVQVTKYVCRDIAISSMVSGHKNFMKLIGCCFDFKYHPVLVYDGVKKHYTLDPSEQPWKMNFKYHPVLVYDGVKKHYALDVREQPWKRRMKIAEDIATALAYLHTAFPRPFVYSNMNLENILLDEDGVAKLLNFSYCVSIPEGETFVAALDWAYDGYDFREPNFIENGVVSEKTDAFGIGILMQMLLSGEERFRDLCLDGEKVEATPRRTFPNWDSIFLEERSMKEIIDPKMLEEMGEISEEELCRMKAFLMLSHRCIALRGEVPTMVEVAKELKKIQRCIGLKIASSSLSGETQSDSAQGISSSVSLSSET